MSHNNTRNGKAGHGRKFVLDGQLHWGVPESEVDDWQGPGTAVPEELMVGAAQRLYGKMLAGESKEEAEKEVKGWLDGILRARRWIKGG